MIIHTNTAADAGSVLAHTIIAMAKANHSLLNWDGNTSREDLIENIRTYVGEFTGWKLLKVTFENNRLEIWGSDGAGVQLVPVNYDGVVILEEKDMTKVEYLLSYDVKYGTEIYGRLRHVGFYYPHLAELKQLLTLH